MRVQPLLTWWESQIEKQTRLASDAFATGKVAVEIVKILFECKDWEGLNSNIVLISKRRQQLKQALVDMVQEAMTYVDKAPDYDKKMELIHTLRAVTDGKIHVELERARLTRTLSKIRESEGKIAEAADLLSEVQVETYGSMDKEEKVEYILEQVRLCLEKGDFVRGTIVSKKLTAKTFKDDLMQDLKIRYYDLLNRISDEKDEYLDIANNYYSILQTPTVQEKAESWKAALKNIAVHLVLAPHDNHQSDFLARLLQEKKLDQLKAYKVLLTLFNTLELIQWSSFQNMYKTELMAHAAFGGNKKEARWKDLHTRVIQHNIRVIATYYENITMARLSKLLELSEDEAEKHVCDMVVKGALWCRIDRLGGVVTLQASKDPADVLNQWSNNISQLLSKVEKAGHLIHKESMLHGVAAK